MNGQLDATAALRPEKGTPVPGEWDVDCMFLEMRKMSFPCQESNHYSLVTHFVAECNFTSNTRIHQVMLIKYPVVIILKMYVTNIDRDCRVQCCMTV
jgi:hypothetical protein